MPPNRIVRTASGVDAEQFYPGPSSVENALPSRPRVVFTGRLHPQKNLEILLDAWPGVAQKTPATLILVGDGSERSSLVERAKTLGVADRIHFTGAVSNVADYLRAGDIFALPSIAEGMSNSLLEAMATALPCLASEIGGNTDLINDGISGRLIRPGDRSGWSAALIQTLENPDVAARFGLAARKRVEEEFAFSPSWCVDRYIALYRRLLDC